MSTDWKPKRDFAEVERLLCAPGNLHEVETRVIDGLVQRVYKNLWPSIRAFWLAAVQLHGDKTYVVFEKQRLTFHEVNERAAKAASIFRQTYGISKGDRVAICCRNYPEFLVTFWACHMIGAVTVLVNAWLPAEPLRHCLVQTQCALVIIDPERADRLVSFVHELKLRGVKGVLVLEGHEGKGSWPGMQDWTTIFQNYKGDYLNVIRQDPGITPEDNATIIFTSGTSGLPKGVLSTQRAFLSNAPNNLVGRSRAFLRRGEDLVMAPPPGPQSGILLPTPLFHVTGTSFTLTGTVLGAKIILMRKWNVEEAARLIKEENVMIAGGVPSTVSDLAESSAYGAPLQTILYGGSAVSVALAKRARAAFPMAMISQAYGLTESNATSVGFSGEDYEASTNDTVTELKFLRRCSFHSKGPKAVNDDIPCPTGSAGEIWIRGPNVMKGYFGDPGATSKVLTKDGWLKTGDVGYLDQDGFLYIKDRLKDIIIRGGENVDSVAVENVLYENEGVLEAAAVGVPDNRLGELVAAIVTVKPAFKGKVSSDSLMALAKKRLPKFAVPVMILVRDVDFSHTPSGKIIKTELRRIATEEWSKRSPREPELIMHRAKL
ncbi:hypothetical protein J3R30DRAFT_3694284 [Lentinula aciculospora]|uniref:Acetyl-CoA synthetase-like protein n=1 Tax=Lentinula aciculospora TaxID=153920 RepID=A0A9W9AU33_9AGAR|nr:hypothetical protein J3R30DRAFT_3694284 [Lentinula aciculospora]